MEAEGREGRGGAEKRDTKKGNNGGSWLVHCTENSKHTLLEMKLLGCVLNFYIHVSGAAIFIFPQSVLFGISIFLYSVRELSAQPLEWREGQGTAAKQWLAAVPALSSVPAVEPRVHINDQHTNFHFGKLRIINGNN